MRGENTKEGQEVLHADSMNVGKGGNIVRRWGQGVVHSKEVGLGHGA